MNNLGDVTNQGEINLDSIKSSGFSCFDEEVQNAVYSKVWLSKYGLDINNFKWIKLRDI